MLIECYDLFPVLPALLKILLASEYLPIPLHPTLLLQLLPPVHLLEHHLVKEGGVVPHHQPHHQEPHLQYGAHHGAGGCVADEHGYETGDCHKTGEKSDVLLFNGIPPEGGKPPSTKTDESFQLLKTTFDPLSSLRCPGSSLPTLGSKFKIITSIFKIYVRYGKIFSFK